MGLKRPCMTGSSPLTRGKPRRFRALQHRRRLIPAHAGKTNLASFSKQFDRAHPRSRGENQRGLPALRHHCGSSPLTRGKLGNQPRPPPRRGLIPAHAGKTPRVRPTRIPRPAHPRSRGENVASRTLVILASGSSPLTRGKRFPLARVGVTEGLIPAHAGKTGTYVAGCSPPAAHPRSRGENGPARTLRRTPTGSSPLTRGKPGAGNAPTGWPGLIPAHAGKTGPGLWEVRSRTAHPRSRGENR